jgi:hypothetical protein
LRIGQLRHLVGRHVIDQTVSHRQSLEQHMSRKPCNEVDELIPCRNGQGALGYHSVAYLDTEHKLRFFDKFKPPEAIDIITNADFR